MANQVPNILPLTFFTTTKRIEATPNLIAAQPTHLFQLLFISCVTRVGIMIFACKNSGDEN